MYSWQTSKFSDYAEWSLRALMSLWFFFLNAVNGESANDVYLFLENLKIPPFSFSLEGNFVIYPQDLVHL